MASTTLHVVVKGCVVLPTELAGDGQNYLYRGAVLPRHVPQEVIDRLLQDRLIRRLTITDHDSQEG